jgi:hypothetical protein
MRLTHKGGLACSLRACDRGIAFGVLTLMLFVAPAQAGAHGHRAIACSVAMGSRLRGNDSFDVKAASVA